MSPALPEYFPYVIQLAARAQNLLNVQGALSYDRGPLPPVLIYRRLAAVLIKSGLAPVSVTAGQLTLYATLLRIYRYLIDTVAEQNRMQLLADAVVQSGLNLTSETVTAGFAAFEEVFPASCDLSAMTQQQRHHLLLREMLLVRLAGKNQAIQSLSVLFDGWALEAEPPFRAVLGGLEQVLAKGPVVPDLGLTLLDVLYAPLAAAPDSLGGQLAYIREQWAEVLPAALLEELVGAFDILEEEQRQWGDGGAGPSEVLRFKGGEGALTGPGPGWNLHGAGHYAGYDQPEYEAFSADADWMSHVVMMAKMSHVWLDQLSKWYGYPITRLDQVPDAELDRLAERGFSALWLIGLWERSLASQRIKQLCGNPEAHASAYSLYDYSIAADLGGEAAFLNLKQRAWKRGIRLASDMVPNHCGIYSRWVLEHPDWFIQTEYAPFPTYQFNGEDLSHDPNITLQIEDGYWSRQDAAVVFRMIDRRDGRTRYIYHGNDGTSIPWNDTAQLNYLLPQVREAVIQTILHVARLTPIIRFDAAMTLAKKHYQRLWFPQRGLGGGIPSRAEHALSREEFDHAFPQEFWREVVDRMAVEAPGTLLLAEAFWMMEGYFVRTLGMHRVYNSAFMNMIKQEENAKYRQTIKNVLEFNPEILKRFVNFMNNPDEKTAVEQFGSQGKYFGACVLLATMPGLPMFGHGQIEGFQEKYGMEYRRAYWDEPIDQGLVRGHELWIFPLLKRRWLFSGAEQFALYDFVCHDGAVDENVFAYSNHCGEQRALVLYNNRFGSTSGWIRTAAPTAVRADDGTLSLRAASLAQALQLPDDQRSFVAFRDVSTGFEYLRNTAELHRQGLYAELGEYAFQVFVDFKILSEDDNGSWSKLYQHLDGRGVASLQDELVQLAYQPLIAAFDVCLQSLAKPSALQEAEANFRSELEQVVGGNLAAASSSVQAVMAAAHRPELVRQMLRRVRRAGIRRADLVLDAEGRRFALGLLLTRALLVPHAADALEHYGLLRPLTMFITGGEQVERQSARITAQLCTAVAMAGGLWSETTAEALLVLLEQPVIQTYLLVHDDRGITWFNKERFEIFCSWLAVLVAFDQSCGTSLPAVPTAALKALAGAAGYRLQSFKQLLAALPEGGG